MTAMVVFEERRGTQIRIIADMVDISPEILSR
jgi:hypothetical protein